MRRVDGSRVTAIFRRITVIAAVSCLFAAGILVECGNAAEAGTKEESSNLTIFGADPKAFHNAEDMLPDLSKKSSAIASMLRSWLEVISRIRPLLGFRGGDKSNRELLVDLAGALTKSEMPEDDGASCANILRSFRSVNEEDYGRLRVLAEDAAKRFQREAPPKPKAIDALFREGNERYEKGSFAEAGAKYKEILREFPKHLDARNNLALAEMHGGENALALFHLVVVKTITPGYAGADVNLSTVLERLGLSEEAYRTAKRVAERHASLPMAQYNAGWFYHSRGEYRAARKSLDLALKAVPGYSKAKHLYALNDLESGQQPAAEHLSSLSSEDRARVGVLKLERVKGSPEGSPLVAGNMRRGMTRPNETFAVSGREGDWVAVYHADSGGKHRSWIKGEKATPPESTLPGKSKKGK